jgi:hypothetical protein
MKTITITAMRRPALLERLLVSLLRNDLRGFRILVAAEPCEQTPAILDVCRSYLSGLDHDIHVNDAVLGIRENPRRLLAKTFEGGSDYNIYLEEDLEVAPDLVRMAEWYFANHRPAWLCLNLIAGPCGSAGLLSDPRYPGQLFTSRTFNSLGFVVRRPEWFAFMAGPWQGRPVPAGPDGRRAHWQLHHGWDWSIYEMLATQDGLVSVQPVLARATHTGREGTWSTPDFHDRAFGDLPISTGYDGPFELLPPERLDRQVRSLVVLHDEITRMRVQIEEALAAGKGEKARLRNRLVEPVATKFLGRGPFRRFVARLGEAFSGR